MEQYNNLHQMHTRQRLHCVMSSRAWSVEPSHAGEVRDVRDHKLINDDDEPLKVAVVATQFGSCHVDPSQGQKLPEGSLTELIRYVRPWHGNSFLNADSYKYG